MTTATCKSCGRELLLTSFRLQRNGFRSKTCTECIVNQRRINKENKLAKFNTLISPEFDGKTEREVIDMMTRAKTWLESRGYKITLKGEYTVTKSIKFN